MKQILSILSVIAVSATAWAQSDGPSWIQVNVVKVKPEYQSEFIELQKNEITPFVKKSGSPWRSAWRTGVYGNSYTYVFVTPIESFADYDKPLDLDPGVAAKFTKYVADRDSYAAIYRPDLSKERDNSTPPNVIVVSDIGVAPGRGAEYAEYIKNDVLPYMSDPKSGVEGFEVSQNIFGGPVTWTTVTYLPNFAFIDGGSSASRVLDEAERRTLAKKRVGLVTSVQRSIAQFIPELSYDANSSSSDQE